MIQVQVVDPPAFTPPYDHALCCALARAGAKVQLITSRFAYGEVPEPDGYTRTELFYTRAFGPPASPMRRLSKAADHIPGMLRLSQLAQEADVVHLQWVTVPLLDSRMLPDRPLVLTAHDLLPREPRRGQLQGQRQLMRLVDAIIVHSDYGRRQLVQGLGVPEGKVHVIHHGAFTHVVSGPRAPLPPELDGTPHEMPVVLFVGLLRPYKGLDTLLRAWQRVGGAQLWIAGRPMMDLDPLRALSGPTVRWVPRFVRDGEVAALLERADVVVLPYSRTERFDMSGVLASALAFGKPIVLTDIGGFSEVAATGAGRLVAPDDVDALAAALCEVVDDEDERARLGAAALDAARGPYSWDEAARRTLALYERITPA